MASPISLDKWANSLVGRDWEVFWADDGCCKDNEENQEEPEQKGSDTMPTNTVDSVPPGIEAVARGEVDEDAAEEDVEDWYDSHIVGIESFVKETGNYSFHVRFEGDETLYTMVLEPKKVRPSIKAWIERSKALLNFQPPAQTSASGTTKSEKQVEDFTDWESSLPGDTSTVYDKEHLAQLKAQHHTDDASCQSTPLTDIPGNQSSLPLDTTRRQVHNLPDPTEVKSIRNLLHIICAQVYLRSRLAPIVVPDDGGPSEAYVDHLLECLKWLAEACRWYLKSWDIHKILFFTPPRLSVDNPSKGEVKWSEDYAITVGLQEGRRVITNLLRIDTSISGCKKRKAADSSPVTGGVRKTKRRRINKSMLDFIKESERGSEAPSPGEDEFLSSSAVENFVEQVQSNDNRWYTALFGRMMQSLSLNVVSPFLVWKHRVEIILGDRPESEIKDADSEGETSGDESDKDGDEKSEGNQQEQSAMGSRFYTLDEIEACEGAARNDAVLRTLDLSKWRDRLRHKLSEISNFEKECWLIIAQLFSKPDGVVSDKNSDKLYMDLVQVRDKSLSPTSSVSNVSPFGRSSSVLCRKVLDDATTIRSWYLDLHRVEASKERLVFIEKMATRASELPRLPPSEYSATLDVLFDEAVARLRKISEGYSDYLTRFNKYKSILLSRSASDTDEGIDFMTPGGVTRALEELGNIQVLSVAEEMLAVRLDVLLWMASARALLARADIPFDEMVALKKSVDAILHGRSETRTRMLGSIEANDKVNTEVRSFAESDVAALGGSPVSILNSKYTITCGWKERANSIISKIKQHTGQCSMTQKPPMVDFKRIHALREEYQNLGIFLPEDNAFLDEVYNSASKWSKELNDSLLEGRKPLPDLLTRLQKSKVDRPSGIIVDPARHVVDLLVDLLLWHNQITESTRVATIAADKSSKSLHHLIAEGAEILEAFGNRSDETTLSIDHVVVRKLMSKELDSRRPMRMISCEKLKSTELGTALIGRIIREDKELGSPLVLLLHTLWQASASELVQEYDSRKGTKSAITLELASDLVQKKPIYEGAEALGLRTTEQETRLCTLVSEAEKAEIEASRLLAASKELFRGPSRHPDAIHEHLGLLKETHGLFKVPLTAAGPGLVLKKDLEQKLEHQVKVVGWLVRTLPYEFLHKVHYNLDPENRMSWDVLLALHERKPGGLEKMGDCAGIALRLADVFEAANAWQQEISKVTMLSNRGGKRRAEAVDAETDGTLLRKVDVEQVYRLAKDPVLQKVAMPRESAVTSILERAKTFETHLHKFLGQDYDGTNPDRAPYPDSHSLIGRNGEFLLYRFTGSPLYDSLLSSIDEIATIAQDVFADTPGKAAFEWIRQATAWIDSLREAVTRKAYPACSATDRLVISESDAKSILDNGRSFFLDIPDDLRKTLSTHRILISSTKIGEKLKVLIKKGGAHHSVGGTAIRWCPVLFDSLREDISRLDTWRAQVEKVESDFNELPIDGNGSLHDENALVNLHELLEEVSMLIEEGVESLVVAPAKEAFGKLGELQTNLTSIMSQKSSSFTYDRIAKRRFEDGNALLTDRFNLLDALLARSELESDDLTMPDVPNLEVLSEEKPTVRDACRAYLEKGLRRTLYLIGLEPTDPESPAHTLCATKAWEIELELYTRFQASQGTNEVSLEYKEKAQTLLVLFEDCANPNVCIQVLLGDLEVSDLVVMTAEYIFGERESDMDFTPIDEREKLNSSMDKSDTHIELGRALTETEDVKMEGNGNGEVELGLSGEDVVAPPCPQERPEDESPPDEAIASAEYDPTIMELETIDAVKDGEHSPNASPVDQLSPPPDAPPSLAAPVRPEAPRSLPAPARPGAPPSLAASLGKTALTKKSTSKVSQSKAPKRGKYLLNSDGADSFYLAVSKPLLRFKARFYLESDGHVRLHNLLPESMTEKGRLRLEEFAKFLAGKLKGGRWEAVTIRMSVSSDEDAKKLKKYYKEYESTKRIAMFSINENAKLFLVTPKFHRTAGKVLGTSFNTEKSTYAIVLTRD